ncbi:alpha-2,8-sialyltransferase 8E-like [Ptychodera flava]|uniref:alpha-2,8-sialyltransferase 8E-like n=1 Tax=Ptychodera flava TaxID=63121 RepID=UPI00396A5052
MGFRRIKWVFCTYRCRSAKAAKVAVLILLAFLNLLLVQLYTGRMDITSIRGRTLQCVRNASHLNNNLTSVPNFCETEVVNQFGFRNRTEDNRASVTVLKQTSNYSSHLNETKTVQVKVFNVTAMVNKTTTVKNSTNLLKITKEKSSNAAVHSKIRIAKKIVKKRIQPAKKTRMPIPEYILYESVKSEWQFNATAAQEFRSLLETECCSSNLLFLTKQNAKINTYIRYEAEQRSFAKISSDVYNRLPEDTPFKKQTFKKCSIVGNSGLVSGKGCGKSIDSADFVIRFNLAKVRGYDKDVGNRTDLVTCNPTIFRDRYSNLSTNESVDKLIQYVLNEYGAVTFWLPAFSNIFCTKLSFLAQDVLNRVHMDAVFPHPEHFGLARDFWKTRDIDPIRISSGLMLITAAMNFCEELHVYGFWPYSKDALGKPIYYHYFDKEAIMLPDWKIKKKWHEMPNEFQTLVTLHNAGVIRLHVKNC